MSSRRSSTTSGSTHAHLTPSRGGTRGGRGRSSRARSSSMLLVGVRSASAALERLHAAAGRRRRTVPAGRRRRRPEGHRAVRLAACRRAALRADGRNGRYRLRTDRGLRGAAQRAAWTTCRSSSTLEDAKQPTGGTLLVSPQGGADPPDLEVVGFSPGVPRTGRPSGPEPAPRAAWPIAVIVVVRQ